MIVKRQYFKIVGLIILLLTFLVGAGGVSSLGAKEIGDINIDYRISGAGYPLVMIRGYSGTMDMWDPTVLRILSSRYKVVTFDCVVKSKRLQGILFTVRPVPGRGL